MSVELIELSGENLTVDQVSLVSRKQVGVKICENKDVLNKVRRAQKVLMDTFRSHSKLLTQRQK
jgi:histidine ammonia-lyase